MAVLGANNPTLLDLATREDPDGKIAKVVEILNQQNEILDDMSWMMGNMADGHKSTIRSGIPQPTWRKLYQGVQPTKSTTVQVKDNTGELTAFSEIDAELARLADDRNEFLLTESAPHIEGMNQEIAKTLFYGNEGTKPEAFTGLAPRFNSLSAENADNIINAGGSDNRRSIWLVVWGPNTCHGIVPRGSTAGLEVDFKGLVTVENSPNSSDGGRWDAYRTKFMWKAGLTVRDWRYIVRIANIDANDISIRYNNGQFVATDGTTAQGPHLPNLMFQAMRLVPNLSFGRPAFYMTRDLLTALQQQTAAAVQGSTLTMENVGGRFVESFKGVPIRRVDALAVDEAAVA